MTEATYCYAHPNQETSLRCKRCDRPMCTSCAQHTPTGYLCKECINQHKKTFDTALGRDYVAGILTTSILSFFAAGLLSFAAMFIGFYMIFISVAAAGTVGIFLANTTLKVTGKRRSRALFITCAAGVVLGAAPSALYLLLTANFYPLIFVGIYAFIATSTVYARLAGIQL